MGPAADSTTSIVEIAAHVCECAVQAFKEFSQRQWLKNKTTLCHPKRKKTKATVTVQKAYRGLQAVRE